MIRIYPKKDILDMVNGSPRKTASDHLGKAITGKILDQLMKDDALGIIFFDNRLGVIKEDNVGALFTSYSESLDVLASSGSEIAYDSSFFEESRDFFEFLKNNLPNNHKLLQATNEKISLCNKIALSVAQFRLTAAKSMPPSPQETKWRTQGAVECILQGVSL